MGRDLNLAVLTGSVYSQPTLVTIKNNKKILLFTLRVRESFELSDGSPASHDNYFTVEVLGRNAEKYLSEIGMHQRYMVTGYLRVDDLNGVEKIRIRAYRIERD